MLQDLDLIHNPNLGCDEYQILRRKDNNQVAEILLNQNVSITLVTGYNVKFRYAVVKRWQELEEQVRTIRIIPPQIQRYTERVATVPVKHFIACLYFFFQVAYN